MGIALTSGTVPAEAVASMAKDSIVFAMANPNPEVHPDVAHANGACVVATGLNVATVEPPRRVDTSWLPPASV